nr:hypothetical protein [Tanacetum cinerariifolium]
LLCTAYRKVMDPLRASWRRIYSIEQKVELHGNNGHAKMAKESRCRIEGEISKICYGQLKLFDEKVLVGTKCFGQSKVVYLTMKGDYYRYLAEFRNKNTLQLLFQAIDEAITELTTLGEESDKEDIILITLILRRINQNLTMWKSDMQSKTRDELHVVRFATPADKGRERRRRANDRYALAMSVPNEPINDVPSICDIQDEIKKPVKPIDQEQKE